MPEGIGAVVLRVLRRVAGSGQSGREWLVGEGMIFRLVVPGEEASRLVAVYDRAVARAQRVRMLLVLAGLDAPSVLVVPSWTEAGEPVVYVSGLTVSARQSLAEILRPSPPPDDDRGGGQRAA
ncbi:MAG: hypothetical protein ACRDSH_19980 [Pseudonocardiaceae bacterium]